MYELCPIRNYICPFCGSSKGIQHCGIANKSNKNPDNRISKMKDCPQGKIKKRGMRYVEKPEEKHDTQW